MNTQMAVTYKKSQIDTTDPLSLIIMLYDKAINLLDKAKKEISEEDYEEKTKSLTKANDIVYELLGSLDVEKGGEIASSLQKLYDFVIREIMDADMKLNLESLDNARRVLSELKESWKSIKENPNTTKEDTVANDGGVNISA